MFADGTLNLDPHNKPPNEHETSRGNHDMPMQTFRFPRPSLSSLGLSWPLLVATAACIGSLLFTTSQVLGDTDTYLHLTSGYWIFSHQAVPSTDPFSHSLAGTPWITHEWLAQCLLALAYKMGGWTALTFLTYASFALTLAYLLRFLLKRMPPLYALLFTALASAPLATHLLARPHVLGWLVLLIWVSALVEASEDKRPPPKWLLGLMVLWANLHGSFTLGLAIVLPLAVEACLDSPPERRGERLRSWALFFGLSMLAAMVTPAGWKGIWFTLHLLNLKYLKAIGEWAPAGFSAFNPLEMWLIVLLGMGLLGYLRLPLIRLLLLLGLLHQALAHGRYIALFGLLVPVLIASPFGKLYAALSVGKPSASGLDRIFDELAAPAKRVTIVIAVLAVLSTAVATGNAGRHTPKASITPKAAVDAALQAGASGHVLNAYSFGGYLIYRGIPVFIDGRADLYGDKHLEAYIQAVEEGKADKIQKIVDEFNITWTLLSPTSAAVPYLNTRTDWRKIYEDETAVVHLRQSAR